MSESSLGLKGRVVFLKADGTPAKVDGVPTWTLDEAAEGPVATMTVNPEDPAEATFTPLPIPDSVQAAWSAQGRVSADADLDVDETREVAAQFVITVHRDEAQTAGVTFTEVTPPAAA